MAKVNVEKSDDNVLLPVKDFFALVILSSFDKRRKNSSSPSFLDYAVCNIAELVATTKNERVR